MFKEWLLDDLPEWFKLTDEQVQKLLSAPIVDLLLHKDNGDVEVQRAALARVHSFHPVPAEIAPEQSDEQWREHLAHLGSEAGGRLWHLHTSLVEQVPVDVEGGLEVRRRKHVDNKPVN
jgi:hypothetical protein